MLSAGFVTLQKRHIGITVFYLLASDQTRWWLDLFAMVVGVFALYMLISDTLIRALRIDRSLERAGSGWNSPMPMILKTVLVVGLLHLSHPASDEPVTATSRAATIEFGVLLLTALIVFRYLLQIGHHYLGDASIFGVMDDAINAFGERSQPEGIHRRSIAIGIGYVSLGIVVVLLLLMMTGMPLGIVTLIISVVCAFLFFGPKGLYLVSTNAFGLLEKYPLVAVPLFVLMATILERAGIAEDLFDAMSIFAGNLRGGVALQTTIVAVILAAMSGVMGGEIVMLGLVALAAAAASQIRPKTRHRPDLRGRRLGDAHSAVDRHDRLWSERRRRDRRSVRGRLHSRPHAGTFYVIYVLVRCNLNPQLAPTAQRNCANGRR